jgi:transcriptional regulator of heat shock response
LDKVVNKIFNKIDWKVEVIIGSKNPFGQDCSSVLAKYRAKDNQGILGILGPTRMDYQTNFSLVKYSQQIINGLDW